MGRVWVVGSVALALVTDSCAALAQVTPAGDANSFSLSVHARSTSATARTERAAWLSLAVPLDRIAAPPVAAARVALPAAESGEAPVEAAAEAPAPVTLAQLKALADFSRRATAAALAVAGAAADRRRLDSLSARSRASALLPDLRLRAQRSTDQALRWAPTGDDPYRVTQADGTGTTLEASATFRLDRLLFSREELVVERLRAQAGAERLKLERRVLEAVLGLFRARELGCAGDADEGGRTLQLLRGVELAAELDVLTAGWFAEHASDFGRSVWGFPEAALGGCQAPAAAPEPAPTNPVASLGDSE
jgi:hypothetical protein